MKTLKSAGGKWWAYMVLIVAVILLNILLFFAIGGNIPASNAVSVLNDVTVIDGILIGFVAVVMGENLAELHEEKAEFRGFRELYNHPRIRPIVVLGLFDVVIVLGMTASIIVCLVELSHIDGAGNAVQPTSVLAPVFVTTSALTLFAYRLIRQLVK